MKRKILLASGISIVCCLGLASAFFKADEVKQDKQEVDVMEETQQQ